VFGRAFVIWMVLTLGDPKKILGYQSTQCLTVQYELVGFRIGDVTFFSLNKRVACLVSLRKIPLRAALLLEPSPSESFDPYSVQSDLIACRITDGHNFCMYAKCTRTMRTSPIVHHHFGFRMTMVSLQNDNVSLSILIRSSINKVTKTADSGFDFFSAADDDDDDDVASCNLSSLFLLTNQKKQPCAL
jgi:hypothetical protein